MTTRARRAGAVALFCVFATPVGLFAQQAALSTLTIVEVKHDMVLEFEELQKEFNAAARGAGVTGRTISQVVRGAASEYYILAPVNSFADYDEPNVVAQAMGEAGWAQWVARVTKTVQNRRIDTIRARPDLSIPLADGRTPTLLVLRTVEHLPGRFRDYDTWLSEKWVPAMKDAGMNGVLFARNAFGGSSRLWYEASFIDDWAVLDGVHPALSDRDEARTREVLGRAGSMTHAPTVKILRLRPDLSIQP